MISATILGNIGRDAELRFTPKGEPVVNFTLASNMRSKDGDVTTWVSCTLWGKRGEKVASMLKTGVRIVARGELHMREYTRNDNTKGESLDLRVDDFSFATPKTEGEAAPKEERAQRAPQRSGKPQGGRDRSPPPAEIPDEDDYLPEAFR